MSNIDGARGLRISLTDLVRLRSLRAEIPIDAPIVADAASDRAFFELLENVLENSRFAEEADCLQHGTTSIMLHSIAVAHLSCRVARRMGWTAHLSELERAALLHDFFLYDWHRPAPGQELHAFKHASRAATRARAAFPDLTEREDDSIRCHMFPITAVPPHHREGWIITCVDKWCASYETLVRTGLAYPRLRALCEEYVPGIRLSASVDSPAAGSSVAGPTAAGPVPINSSTAGSSAAGADN